MKRIIVPNNIEIIVTSFGGVGTSFLLDFINKNKLANSTSDLDFFKHSPIPPITFNKKVKFIYIYGDPMLATVSLFRRGYHHYQSKKLLFYKNIKPISKKTTLEEYAQGRIDKFCFEEHFFNWREKFLTHPTCFIRYDKIHEVKEHLIEFLELPKSRINDFPEFKERNSDINALDNKTINGLNYLYGDFTKKLEKYNHIEILIPKSKYYWLKYINWYYLKGLFNQLFRYFGITIRNFSPATFKSLIKLKPKNWRI